MKRLSLFSLLLLSVSCKDPIVFQSYLAIVHISPNDGAVNVPVNAVATATFSEALQEDSVTPLEVYLADPDGEPVDSELSYDSATYTVQVTPAEDLLTNMLYVLVLGEELEGMESGLMVQAIETEFTTSGLGGGGTQNQSPIANAGEDQTVALNDEVLLDGSISQDPDGDELTFFWEIIDRPDESIAELDDGSLEAPSFSADVQGTFIVSLGVDDGLVISEPDYVQIFVE